MAIVGVLVIGTTGLSAYALSRTTASEASPVPIRTDFDYGAPQQESVRIAVVGDSNTEVDSPDFAAGHIGGGSWVTQLIGNGYTFAGGWADGGTTSVTQAANLAPVADVDLLLVMTGTNDLGQDVSFEETTASIDTMVSKAPAARVVLLAIPPRNEETATSTVEFNANLSSLAAARGWEFFDGLTFLRSPDGGFVEGTTGDGIHLVRDAYAEYGRSVRAYLAD